MSGPPARSSNQKKITANPATSRTPISNSLESNLCRVPGCHRAPCKLKSHQRYDPCGRRRRTQQRVNHVANPVVDEYSALVLATSIGRDGVDGMPALPIETDGHSRTLFHHFFDAVFPRLVTLFRGPAVAGMEDYKQSILATALSSESYCTGIMVQAQTDIDTSRRAVEETRESLVVYSNTLQAFRKQVMAVQGLPHPMQIEIALLSLCTLLSYDTFHERDSSAMMHWKGLQQLVALRGGISNVTLSLQYVVHCDRLCGQRLRMPPAFVLAPTRSEHLPIPLFSWYGSKFLTLNQSRSCPISARLINHCVDVCGLIGLWEVSKGDKPAHVLKVPPSIECLMGIRDRVDENFTILHSELWNKRVRDKFILWTARILEYPYTWINYVPTITSLHCNHLITYLQGQDLLAWNKDIDLLSWILFALAVVPAKYCGRDWVMKQLQKVLASKYRSPSWPEDWQAQELVNVQCFVWCDSMYTTRFREVCAELIPSVASLEPKEVETVATKNATPLVERFKPETPEASLRPCCG